MLIQECLEPFGSLNCDYLVEFQTTQPLPEDWKSRIEIVKRSRGFGQNGDFPFFEARFQKDLVPQGHIWLIGRIHISGIGDPSVIESFVVKHMRNLGVGLSLYQRAIEEFGSLYTCWQTHSISANRVWISITKKYHCEFKKSRLYAYNEPNRRPLRYPKGFFRERSVK